MFRKNLSREFWKAHARGFSDKGRIRRGKRAALRALARRFLCIAAGSASGGTPSPGSATGRGSSVCSAEASNIARAPRAPGISDQLSAACPP